MEERINFVRIILVLFIILLGGTIGYRLVEGWSLLDSLYMTIITISTVGYSEVHDLSVSGKIFSSLLILCGVGAAFYTFTTIMQYFIRGNLRNLFGGNQSMESKISKISNHFIICAYGRVGEIIAQKLKDEGVDFVIVDSNLNAISRANACGFLSIQGDASLQETLSKAGIERARGILVVTDNDATNTFIIVTARQVKPDIRIIARASTAESEIKLEMVGADKAMNPYSSVGERMARSILHPFVSDFLEDALSGPGKDRYLEELSIGESTIINEITIGEAQKHSNGAVILAIRKKGGKLLPKPAEDVVIDEGDKLVILGTAEQIAGMENLAESK